VPIFNQFGEKTLNNFMLEYLVSEIEYSTNSSLTRKIQIIQHQLTYQALGAADEDEYLGYHLARTRKAQRGVLYDSVHHPKEYR
jgi:plasmid maintenance system killer protein